MKGVKFNPKIIFQFYSKSMDAKPGKGRGEKIPGKDILKFADLAAIPNWRKILSNFYKGAFRLDGKMWQSVERKRTHLEIQPLKVIKYFMTLFRWIPIRNYQKIQHWQRVLVEKLVNLRNNKYDQKILRSTLIFSIVKRMRSKCIARKWPNINSLKKQRLHY